MKKRLAFVADNFVYGGIERVMVNYLNIVDYSKYDVDVIILDPKTEDIIKEIPSSCRIHKIKLQRWLCPQAYFKFALKHSWGVLLYGIVSMGSFLIRPFLRLKFSKLGKFDIVIAFSGHYNDLYAASQLMSSKKKAAWLHGNLMEYMSMSPGYEIMHNKFDKLVVLNEFGNSEVVVSKPWMNVKERVVKMYNPILAGKMADSVDQKRAEELRRSYGRYVLMVARFDATSKDHKTLVDAIEEINKVRDVNLVLVGDGPSKKDVESYVENKGMKDRVFFEGSRSDVSNYYASAGVYVLSSYFEGLPTVVLEAMAFSLPVVATDCPFGPREILGNNDYGLLCKVEDSKDMADKILRFFEDDALYQKYKEKGAQRIKDFAPDTIKAQFESMLEQL